MSASEDGRERVWDFQTGELKATLLSLHEADGWVVLAPDGRFDAPPGVRRRFLWRLGPEITDVAPSQELVTKFYSPGLLAELLTGTKPKVPLSIVQVERPPLRVSLSWTLPEGYPGRVSRGGKVFAHQIAVSVAVYEPGKTKIRQVYLFRNAVLVKSWNIGLDKNSKLLGTTPQGKWSSLTSIVSIEAGENRFTAYALAEDGTRSPVGELVVAGDEPVKP